MFKNAKTRSPNLLLINRLRDRVLILVAAAVFIFIPFLFAQEKDLEVNIDVGANTQALPAVFKPGIDLSGRGFSAQLSWPQNLAHQEAIALWQKDMGFTGIFRIQFNLWEIEQMGKNKRLQSRLLDNYEDLIKKVSDSGAIVILNFYGMPAGLGRVLDKKSPPVDFAAFKAVVKDAMNYLSCEKKYNIWYEVWSAPDLEEFFLGRKQDYFYLYRALATAAKELEAKSKIHIPVGGPAASWWFQNFDGNTIVTPERSLIYEWIKFCYSSRLPIDFVSWHSYSSDPRIDQEITFYRKTGPALIRDWLSYFRYSKDTLLVVDEWNYDRNLNTDTHRNGESFVSASYIPARIWGMFEAGIDRQLYFSLEDFQNNKEGVERNIGALWLESDQTGYKGGTKAVYNVLRMLRGLGDKLIKTSLPQDDFITVIATKKENQVIILISNYIDADAGKNYIARNISSLNSADKKILLNLLSSGELDKLLSGKADIFSLRIKAKLKSMLEKAKQLNMLCQQLKSTPRQIKLSLKNLNGNYAYKKYLVDSACARNYNFIPAEEKEFTTVDIYQEAISLKPYSVMLLVFEKLPEAKVKTEEKTEAETKTDTAVNIDAVTKTSAPKDNGG